MEILALHCCYIEDLLYADTVGKIRAQYESMMEVGALLLLLLFRLTHTHACAFWRTVNCLSCRRMSGCVALS